jgi:hypothetical protein
MNRRGFFRSLAAAALGAVGSRLLPVPPSPWSTVTLTAKRLGCFVKVPNELLRFAVPASHLIHDELTKDMARSYNLAFLTMEKTNVVATWVRE